MNKLLFVIFVSIPGFILAQNQSKLTLYESPEYEDEIKTDSIQSIYTSQNGNTGIVRQNKKYIFFDIFNNKLEKIHTKSTKTIKKESYLGDIFYNDEIKVFTETYLKKDLKVISCYLLNLTDKTFNKIQLSSIQVDKKLNSFLGKKGANFSISPNQNHFTITTYKIHKGVIYFYINVYNAKTFKLIFKKQTTRKENRFYSVYDIQIDNEKNVYILGESFYNKSSPKRKSETIHYFMVEKFSSNDYVQLKFNFENKYIKTLKASVFDNHYNLYGFYSDKNLNKIKGTCNISINMQTMKILDKTLQDLPEKVYNDLFGNNRGAKKKGKELSNFKIDYILKDSENNIYLMAEEFYITRNHFGGLNPYGLGNSVHHYDDILIIKFDKSGNLDWGRSIFKKDTEPSYNAFLKNNELHIILNSGKNLKELDDGRTKTSQGYFETSALYDFVYSNKGELLINKIQNNKNNAYYLPRYGNFVNDKFIMISDSRRKRKFMSLE